MLLVFKWSLFRTPLYYINVTIKMSKRNFNKKIVFLKFISPGPEFPSNECRSFPMLSIVTCFIPSTTTTTPTPMLLKGAKLQTITVTRQLH